MKNSERDELSAKMRTWKVEPCVPASFQREVWQHIAARQTMREEASLPHFLQWLFSQLVRPQYSVAIAALGLSLSLGAAHIQARQENTKLAKQLEARYAASIDPLAMAAR